jgi:GNAT superfamily N-acetyltransferase
MKDLACWSFQEGGNQEFPVSSRPLCDPAGLRPMACLVGRVQRILWSVGRDRACPRNYAWARFFDAYEPVHGLVVESGGRLLGLTHYLFHRSTTAIEPSCYLQDLFTSETARGKGVGKVLINAVYQQARLAGSPRVYWQTCETNLTAMQLYDKVAERSGIVVFRKLFRRPFGFSDPCPPAQVSQSGNGYPSRRLVDKSGCHDRVTKQA